MSADWAKWGVAVVKAVHKCETEDELTAVLAKINPNLAGYRAWDQGKADALMSLIAITRSELLNKGGMR